MYVKSPLSRLSHPDGTICGIGVRDLDTANNNASSQAYDSQCKPDLESAERHED